MKTVYSDDPHEWGRKVRDFHKPIKGTISDGSRYHALNPELFYWAHATFVDQVIYITDTFIRRLSRRGEGADLQRRQDLVQPLRGQRPRPAADLCRLRRVLGRHARAVRPAQDRSVRHRLHPQGDTGPALDSQAGLAAPVRATERLHPPGAGRHHAPQMRDVCQLEWDDKKEKRFQRFAAAVRALNPLVNRLPLWLVYTPWAVTAWRHAGVDPRKRHNGAS